MPTPPPPTTPKPPAAAFTISGAKNTDPGLPAGADLNGEYTKTGHVCNGKPVWQKGGSSGLVLYLDDAAFWDVAGARRAIDCSDDADFQYLSSQQSCQESPDGAGCAGEWTESVGGGGFQLNPNLRVVASASAVTPQG